MKIITIRHGQTTGNTGRIVESRVGGVLTDKGIAQAKRAAQQIKEEKLDAAYSSDKQRCIDTANYILEYHPNLQLHTSSKIVELDKGIFDGGSWDDLPDYINDDTYIDMAIEGGESWSDVRHRVVEFLNEIFIEQYDQVLIVTHDGVLKVMHSIFEDMPLSQANKIYHENAKPYEWIMEAPFSTEDVRQ